MRPLYAQCVARRARLWLSGTHGRSSSAYSWGVRSYHGSRIAAISVADRIKQFLPADATEETPETLFRPSPPITSHPGSGVTAFTTEITEIEALVTQGKLALACEQLLQQLPLHVVLNALVDRIVPLVKRGPFAELGVFELAYHLHVLDQSALASQLLQSARTADSNKSVHLSEFELVSALVGGLRTAEEVDGAVQELTELYFPQILRSDHTPWLKTRLLAALDDSDFERVFRKWHNVILPTIGPSGIALLVFSNTSVAVYDILKRCVFDMWDEDYVNALVRATTTTKGFARAWWQLRRRLQDGSCSNADPVLATAVPSILKVALQLRRTYDVASICKFGAAQLQRDPNLLAKALLAAAFAQKRPSDEAMQLVTSPQTKLHNFLVGRTLTPVSDDPIKCDNVVALAALKLQKLRASDTVLWQLMLSLPSNLVLGHRSSVALAPLISTRPYVEQLRYMALPVISPEGVTELLRLHISRIMVHRRVNRVPDAAQQAVDDVNMVIAGMMLASEKIEKLSPESKEHKLTAMVSGVFEKWDKTRATQLVASAARSRTSVASTFVDQVVRLLIDQKGYTLALQVLRLVNRRQRTATLEALLLGIARDTPSKSHTSIFWIMHETDTPIPPYILNKVLFELCRSPLLTESQLKNQFQSIRRILLLRLKTGVSPKAAIALVEAVLSSAIAHRGGSRMRLRWALDVAKLANVPKEKFAQWTHTLVTMQKNNQGYWAS